jgi:hypothetical protein
MAQQLEFSEFERNRFQETSRLMTFVGIFWVVISVLVVGILAIGLLAMSVVAAKGSASGTGSVFVTLGLGAVDQIALLATGVFTIITAGSLARVARGPVDALEGMMTVLRNLRTMFIFYAVTVGVDVVTDLLELVKK